MSNWPYQIMRRNVYMQHIGLYMSIDLSGIFYMSS